MKTTIKEMELSKKEMLINAIRTLEIITKCNIEFGRGDNIITNEIPSHKTIQINEVGNMYGVPNYKDKFCTLFQNQRLEVLQLFLDKTDSFNTKEEGEKLLETIINKYKNINKSESRRDK